MQYCIQITKKIGMMFSNVVKKVSSLSLALVIGVGGAAAAAIQYPAEGGTWDYGKKNGGVTAYSYYTVDRVHGSSISRDGKVQATSIWTRAGKQSKADKEGAPWTSYNYHYRVKE